MKPTIITCCAFTLFLSGCASFSTIPLTRQDSGLVAGDSNGEGRLGCRTRPFRGIPMKVKVQTHVDVWIDERYVLYKGEKFETWREKPLANKLYSVRTEAVITDQIVITDFKRPASGVLDVNIDFTDNQYIDKITSDLTDTTITDSAELLTTIITKTGVAGFNADTGTPPTNDRWQWKIRTVAYQRFDINAPDFEHQLEQFVNLHMNGCNRCSGMPTYDQVSQLPVSAIAN
jgi:hypothetical protein